jgi:1,4-dihydroxy-2-naphthoate octaprenyltransferase
VLAGTGVAAYLGEAVWWKSLLALVVAVALQVGVNYANDYSDGIRGTDTDRVGPVRLVGQHRARPENVKLMAMVFFGVAALAGLALVALSQAWVMIPLGILAIVAAWRYTGGDNPYGYRGLGEVYVFVFFGLMATLGTLYTQAGSLTWIGLAGAVGVGSIASAILVANNLRDIPTDREAGKRTLAVRMGDRWTRRFYTALVVAAFGVALLCTRVRWPVVLTLLAVPAGVVPVRQIRNGASGRELIAVLGATARLQLSFGAAFALGLALGG